MIRVVVVGYGLMGALHARIVQSIDGAELVGVVELSPERITIGQSELDVPFVTEIEQVIDSCDAVIVTLPDELHVDVCVKALKAGKYVLVEKPLATNAAGSQKILNAQMAPDRLMVAHLLRFDLRLQELKRRMVAGDFGKLELIKIHRANTRAGVARLRGRASVAAFLGIHDLDLLLWLTEEKITSLKATGSKVFSGTWDIALVHLELGSGAIASMENHWLINSASARSCLAGIQVFGSNGTAMLDLSTDELEVATDNEGMSRRVDSRNWTHDGGVSGGSLRREIEAFLHAVRTKSPMPVSGEDGMKSVVALNRIEQALET